MTASSITEEHGLPFNLGMDVFVHFRPFGPEVAGFEERYRKSPAHAPVSENASPAASDADKDQSIPYQDNGHGVVIASSPLLRGESPKHTDTNM